MAVTCPRCGAGATALVCVECLARARGCEHPARHLIVVGSIATTADPRRPGHTRIHHITLRCDQCGAYPSVLTREDS